MPERALISQEATAGPADAIRRFCGLPPGERAAALTPSFLIRASDGGIDVDLRGSRLNGGGPLDRLCHAIHAAEPEELRAGYVVVAPEGPEAHGTGAWLVSVRDGLLAAAFEFANRDGAVAAAPVCSQDICGEKIVEQAVWAMVDRDLAGLLEILDEDCTYTDLERDFTLDGAATCVNHLLLMGYLGVKTVDGLRIRAVNSQVVEVTGAVAESDQRTDADACRRWRMMVGIGKGRIAWAVHHPDFRPGTPA